MYERAAILTNRAGCQNYAVEDWFAKTREDVLCMDGRDAIKFYPRLLDIIDFYLPVEEKRVRPEWLATD